MTDRDTCRWGNHARYPVHTHEGPPDVIEGYIRPSAMEVVISLLLENSLLIVAAVVVAAVLISGA